MSILRYAVLILVTLGAMPLTAERGLLRADCILQIKGTHEGSTSVTVMAMDAPAYSVSPRNGHMVLDLALDDTYLINFEHDGCVSKQLYFDTRVPAELLESEFDFPLKVTLERHKEPFTYAGPVGFIHYQHPIADFGYITDHTAQVDPRLKERMSLMIDGGSDPIQAHPTPVRPSNVDLTPQSASVQDAVSLNTEWGTEVPTLSTIPRSVHRLGQEEVQRIPVPPIADPMEPGPVLPPAQVQVDDAQGKIPAATPVSDGRVRQEELLVERQRVTTIVRLRSVDGHTTEYRRVAHHYGAVFFFRDGINVPEHVYASGIR